MGKTKFNRFKGVRKRRRNKPVAALMTVEEATKPPRRVLPLWPNRGAQSGLKRAKANILKITLKW